ncbi:JAB1/MPN domain-containing protein [Myriangium duriaei CBS 260.36]|uniref:JAB1/MPN domain-containing protein n=1 Tax=Myriangium duriaei CBS 260.36 TaxID=1168546 RepID=A0A9P4J4A6_9PEZI|nr:JAB1/MPN domain-containing protein [Myriangium duriaei CBS 260.36]
MAAMQRPKSVEEIVKEASSFDHKTVYPLRITLRTAQNMLNAATACERSGNLQDAYLFLYRHAEFCMARIATHSERKQPEFKADVARVTKLVIQDLETLEKLKPQINKRYERWQESKARVEAQREKEKAQRGEQGFTSLEDARDAGYAQVLDAGEHKDLALRLANREIRRRGGAMDKGAEQREFDQLARNIRDLERRMDRSDGTADVRGHKETLAASQAFHVAPPVVPSKTPLVSDAVPSLPPKVSAITAPEPLASSEYTFRSVNTTESGTPLRPLFIPTELRERFLSLAAFNTSANLETCGILCGSLISNALFISHLVIPGQTSTSDTCDTTEAGDAALFDYVDSRNLMVCGWIHTHPSQTCFLSSRDLHTTVGYQVMMPESVAIVCAPSRSPSYGIFRLTDPPGKQAILACTKTGLFHPHEQGNLYTDALKPGHVSELKGLKFEVADLRNG